MYDARNLYKSTTNYDNVIPAHTHHNVCVASSAQTEMEKASSRNNDVDCEIYELFIQ